MDAKEALLLFELSYQDTPAFVEALSVLRAVVEDYEKARPLLYAASNLPKDNRYDDVALLISEARNYQKAHRAAKEKP